VVGADDARTDRVAHLSETKRRHASASDEAAKDVVARDVIARGNDKQQPAPAAAADQPTAGSELVTPSAVHAQATGAEVAATAENTALATQTAESPAVADGNSQEWVLGKSLFGKPVHGEIALGDSIFEKTIFGKSAPGKSVSGESASQATAEATAPAEAVALASSGTPRWIAKSMPLTAEEASLDLGELMQRSRAISGAVAVAAEIPSKQQVTASEMIASQAAPEAEAVAEIETTNHAEAAFAAAASAVASASSVRCPACQRSARHH
jgi:hypothetical protein